MSEADKNQFMTAVETAQLDPERLRYITRRLQTGQGLVWVVYGATFCLFDLNKVLDLPSVLLLFCTVLCVAAFFYIPKYYRHRFGWIKPHSTAGGMSNKGFVILMMGLVLLMIFGSRIAPNADILAKVASEELHRLFSDPEHHLNLAPVSLWIACLFLNLWGRLRHPNQGDPNAGYFLCAGVFAWAFVALYPLQRPDVVHLALWKFINTSWFGLSFIALGLYDHFTLVLLLPKRIPEDDDYNDE